MDLVCMYVCTGMTGGICYFVRDKRIELFSTQSRYHSFISLLISHDLQDETRHDTKQLERVHEHDPRLTRRRRRSLRCLLR